MTQAIAFDTLAFVNKLKSAGVPEKQAEVQAVAIAEIVNEQMATKRDIAELKAELKRDIKEGDAGLKRDIKELETALKRDIKELEMGLTIRLGVMMMVAIGVIATLVKIL